MRPSDPEPDPTRFLDGWQAPAPPAGPAPERGPELSTTARTGRLPVHDVEDIELRELPPLAPPTPAAPPHADPQLSAALQQVADLAAARRSRDPRLLPAWQPGAWLGVARRLAGATAEFVQTLQGPLVENHAPLWLLALWPPQRLDAPLLGRWPELATGLEADDAADAAHQLLERLPHGARLWLADLEVDWALVAEIVQVQDAALRASQGQVLRDFIEAERAAGFQRINDGYAPGPDGVRRKPA